MGDKALVCEGKHSDATPPYSVLAGDHLSRLGIGIVHVWAGHGNIKDMEQYQINVMPL